MVRSKTSANLIILAILIAVTTLAYANSFQGEFTLDDFVNITNAGGIRTFQPTLDGIIQAASSQPNGNRWLPNLSFALNYYVHGEDTWGYHLVNLLLHLATGIVFYFLALRTLTLSEPKTKSFPVREAALTAALIWMVHPLQTNGVTYIVQRMTSMSSLFYMSSLLCYVHARIAGRLSTRQLVLFGGCLLMGLMAIVSKENAYMLPVIILAYEVFFFSPAATRGKKYLKFGSWFFVVLLFILLLGMFRLGGNFVSQILDTYAYREFTMTERLLTQSRVIFLYLSLLLLPLPSRLNINHDITLSHGLLSPPQTLLSILGICVIIGLIFFLYHRQRLLSFALFWFLANLVIESTIIPLEIMFEHRLYLPSTFLILGITASLFQLLHKHPRPRRTGVILVLICLSFWTWKRNEVWADNLTLWSDVVAKSPNSERAHNNLGTVYHERRQYKEAEQHLSQAIRLAPEKRLAYVSLGSLYITRNKYQAAMQMLQAGLARQTYLNPSRIYHYMGVIYGKTGRNREALNAAEKALQLDPNDLEPMITIGITYGKMQRYKEADRVFAEAERLGLASTDLYNNWGTAAFKLGDVDRSIQYFRKALEYDPDHPESHYNLGLAYGAKGETEKARAEMNRSIQLRQQFQ